MLVPPARVRRESRPLTTQPPFEAVAPPFDAAAYAEGKRVAKKLPLVVGNLVQDGLGGDRNCVTLFDAAGAHPLPAGDKLTIARGIVAHIAHLLENSRASN